MRNYLSIFRPMNLVFIGLGQFLCAYFLDTTSNLQSLYDGGLHWLIIGTIATASLGYWINDYFDVESDAVNKNRGSKIARFSSWFFYIHILILVSIILFTGRNLGVWFTGLFGFTSISLFVYSKWLKRQPLVGNTLIAAIHFLALFAVYKLFEGIDLILILHFSILASFITLAREIIKDVEDLKGDVLFGAKTLPVVLGVNGTNILVYTVLLFTLSFSFVSFYIQRAYFSPPLIYVYYLYVFIFIVIPIFKIAIEVRYSSEKSEYTKLSKWLKYVIFTGILSILFF